MDIFDQISTSSKADIFDQVAPYAPAEDEPSFMRDVVLKTGKDIAGTFLGAGEVAANLATQTYGLPARGYAEIANLVTGRTDLADKTSEALIYEPQSEFGKAGMGAIAHAFDWWHRKSMAVGTPVQEAVSSVFGETAGNVAGATVASTMEAAPLLLGEVYGKAKGKIAERRTARDSAEIKTRLAEEKRIQSEADLSRANLGDVIPEDPVKAAAIREAATRQFGEDIFDRIQRGYLGEEVAKPKAEVTPYDEFVMGRDVSPADQLERYGADVYDRIRRGYLGDTIEEGAPKPFVAPQVEEYAGPRKPAPKQLSPPTPEGKAPPSPKRGLFPEEKKFALVPEEAPEAVRPFAPAPAEQTLLTGTEKAYRVIVGGGEKPTISKSDIRTSLDLPGDLRKGDVKGNEIVIERGPDNKWYAYADDAEIAGPFDTKSAGDSYRKGLVTGRSSASKMGLAPTPPDPVIEQVDSLRSVLPDFELGKRLWSADGREVIGNTPNTYPPWFKTVFRNDSAREVMSAIDKWKEKGEPSLTKKEARIVASAKDLANDAVKRGEDIGESHWRYLMNESGSAPAITHAAKSFKEFLAPFTTVPMGKEYLILRYKDLLGGLTRVDRIVGDFSKRFKNLSVTDKADVFNAIRGEIPMDSLPEETRLIAKQAHADIERVGALLVRRGLLKKEVFDANKDSYIHYMYLRHVLPDDASIPVGRGGRLDLSYLKARKDLPESVRQELGLIEDVSVAAPVGMGKALGDVVKADFFTKVSSNPEWVWQPSKEIAKLNSEFKAYKQIVERGENVSPEVAAKYRQLGEELAAKSAEAGKAPADFVQLPDSKAYGELQGAFVRKEIANDIVPVYSINPGEIEGLARIWNKAGRGFDTGMTMFKVGKVALNPPTMIRNTISNFIQMNMSGIPIYRIPTAVIDGVKSVMAKDKYYRTLQNNGGFKTNFSIAELGEVLKTFEKAKGGPVDKFFMAVTDMAKYYGKIDDIAKMSLFKDAVTRQGMSVPDAVLYAQKWGMDYSLASRSVKHARRYVLPFVSYQYKIAPLIAESLVKRPWVIAKYAAVPYLMAKWAADKYDWTDKELDKAQKMMAERTKGQGAYTLLPVKDNKGNIEIVNLEYFLPWGNWLEAARDFKGGNYIDTAKQFGGIAGPYGNVITMLNTKREGDVPKDPFTGQPIYSKLDSPKNKYLKQVEWWWQLFAPSSISSNGALGYTARAVAGAKDKWGTEATGAKAFGRWMGVNVGSLDPRSVLVARKAQLRQLDTEIRRIYMDPKYSKEDKKAALKQLQIERRKILNPE